MKPDFDDLVGGEGSEEELVELRRIHELLIAAEPPPAFAVPLHTPRLARRRPQVRLRLPRTRPVLALGFAAAFSAALGVASAVLLAPGGSSFRAGFARPMHGVGAAQTASALIQVGKNDGNGNRPLQFTVKSLPELPHKGWYELYLTEHGKLAVPCGVFQTGTSGTARVKMNAPADLEEYDGWVVTVAGPQGHGGVLLST